MRLFMGHEWMQQRVHWFRDMENITSSIKRVADLPCVAREGTSKKERWLVEVGIPLTIRISGSTFLCYFIWDDNGIKTNIWFSFIERKIKARK